MSIIPEVTANNEETTQEMYNKPKQVACKYCLVNKRISHPYAVNLHGIFSIKHQKTTSIKYQINCKSENNVLPFESISIPDLDPKIDIKSGTGNIAKNLGKFGFINELRLAKLQIDIKDSHLKSSRLISNEILNKERMKTGNKINLLENIRRGSRDCAIIRPPRMTRNCIDKNYRYYTQKNNLKFSSRNFMGKYKSTTTPQFTKED